MVYLAYFFAAGFLVNGIPHFVQGISGHSFQSPFAKPPGVGESSAIVNVLWGSFNLIIGCSLFVGVGSFTIGLNADTLSAGTGGLFIALTLAWYLQKVRNK